jgi:hypothetical protein
MQGGFMSHPFEEGKTYRNRAGEYVVVSIDGEQMKIRYTGGGTLTTTAGIQARIWENIQFEEQLARAEERQRLAREASLAARERARWAKARPKFKGFVATDFEPKQRGIAWSTRKEQGRVLAYDLGPRLKRTYGYWIVPRQSAVHVARKDKYDRDQRDRIAAFFVSAAEEAENAAEDAGTMGGVSFGLYLVKPDGKVDASWPWSALVAGLAKVRARKALMSAMKAQELTLDVYSMQLSYGLVGRVTVQDDGFQWQQETADQEIVRQMEWKDLAETLRSETLENRSELYLYKSIAVEDAVKMGSGITGEIGAVLKALMPVYESCVGK